MRKHQHEEDKRTRKMRRLLDKFNGAIASGVIAQREVDEILAKTARSLEGNTVYQAYKQRN